MNMNILPISYPAETIFYSSERAFGLYNYKTVVKDGKKVVILEGLRRKSLSFLMGGDKDGPCLISDEGGLFWVGEEGQAFARPSLLIGVIKNKRGNTGIFSLSRIITYSRHPYSHKAVDEATKLYNELIGEKE